jgi:hypothetical protein
MAQELHNCQRRRRPSNENDMPEYVIPGYQCYGLGEYTEDRHLFHVFLLLTWSALYTATTSNTAQKQEQEIPPD